MPVDAEYEVAVCCC